ncbi:MAG TPA: hypothetical protein VH601_01210 [Bryobacteraceae bacterium]|jgi:hypothetical protein
MTFKNWFTKEIYIRLPEEGDRFVSTVSYSIAPPKIRSFRFQRTAQFRTDEDAVSSYIESLVAVRSGRKTGTRILEI